MMDIAYQNKHKTLSTVIRQTILHVVLPVAVGVLIYAFWRGIFLIDPYQSVFPLLKSKSAPEWLIYNVNDGLWLYAFLSALIILWGNAKPTGLYIWLTIAIGISFLSEIFQAFHIIPGTFDWYDLLAYTLASIICLINFNYIHFHSLKKF